MEQALRKRIAAKGWLTKESQKLELLISEQSPDLITINDQIQQFEHRLRCFDLAQEEVEKVIDIEILENDIAESAQFRESRRNPFIAAQSILSSSSCQHTDQHVPPSAASDISAVVYPSARLPKLELPKFYGDPTEWYPFWDKFSAAVDRTNIPDITKFTYLQSLVKGEAASAIRGLSTSADNYNIAKDILEKRFGRKERIIFGHIQKLLNTSKNKMDNLWNIYDDLQGHIRSLENLGISGDKYGVILTPLVLSRLPDAIRLEWAREGEGRESDLGFLVDFLYKEVKRQERSQTFGMTEDRKSAKSLPQPSAAALHANTKTQCPFCLLHNHKPAECKSIQNMNCEQLHHKVKELGICFICFGRHFAKRCHSKQKCNECNGRHHHLLCKRVNDVTLNKQVIVTNDETTQNKPCIQFAKSNIQGLTTVMQTVTCRIAQHDVTVLFDSGSDRSFISDKCAKKLGLDLVGRDSVSFSCFGDNKSNKSKLRNIWRLRLGQSEQELLLTGIDTICPPMFRASFPSNFLQGFAGVPFIIDYSEGSIIKVDVLIEIDYYWQMMESEIIRNDTGLVAQRTKLGWMLSGAWSGGLGRSPVSNCQFFCHGEVSDSLVRGLWDLESLGILDKDESIDSVLTKFDQNVKFENGRYTVSLPWKSAKMKGQLIDNLSLAKRRLANLDKRLNKDPELRIRYDNVLSDLESEGIIKEVVETGCELLDKGHPVFYLPHRPVVKESSSTTKVRPVFDASAVGFNGVSLNACLETGPCLLPNLVAVLIRFRRWKVAFTADITKAFLQIRVADCDQDVHRFLWNLNGQLKVMKFDRVPFGNASSPFLLNATVKHHLKKFPPSKAVTELHSNLYVDDFLSGADSVAEAQVIVEEARQIMSKAGMTLTKWTTNIDEVFEKSFAELESKHAETQFTKVLGLKWVSSSDSFSFEGPEFSADLIITKRVVLSFIARLFDPLGFLNPFVMTAKIIFQELWLEGVDWDEPISTGKCDLLMKWFSGIKELQGWIIPRCFVSESWSDLSHPEIHIFCDASEKGYGCVAYLRVKENDVSKVSLVLSKARVAPTKRMTLPRLELMGALLGARLLKFVREALEMPSDCSYYCYTDSMITLGWIKSDANKWKCFVANRVREIQDISEPSCWFHCAGAENPADLVTRGLSASQLMLSTSWLYGPGWLQSGELVGSANQCDLSGENQNLSADISKEAKSVVVLQQVASEPENPIPIERWGSFNKAVRIIGWMIRFCHNARKQGSRLTGEALGVTELLEAEKGLFLTTQDRYFHEEIAQIKDKNVVTRSSNISKFVPFIDQDGLLRAKGRIQFCGLSYDERHPIILPKCHLATLMLRSQHLALKHAGVKQMLSSLRDRFWIIGLRGLARKVKRECVACQRVDSMACNEEFAPLPSSRVNQAPVFSVTGLDFAGPLYCSDYGNKKFYILLFTCGVVRAVHLELVESLTLVDFLHAFRRFAARRGLPEVVYSDNAKTFVSAPSELAKIYGTACPKWVYIAPRSPWWGGWWERLVRSVKGSIKKTLLRSAVKRIELETLLNEVEGCLNSRPLTADGDDIDSAVALTPFHFLIGRGCYTNVNSHDLTSVSRGLTGEDIVEYRSMFQVMLDKFWEMWSKDYLRNLPQVRSKFGKRGSVKLGSMVLVREDNIPRLCWPLGVVTKEFTGRDGVSRTFEISTKRGKIVRSIQRLHCLELHREEADDLPQGVPDSGYVTRYGRKIVSRLPSNN